MQTILILLLMDITQCCCTVAYYSRKTSKSRLHYVIHSWYKVLHYRVQSL